MGLTPRPSPFFCPSPFPHTHIYLPLTSLQCQLPGIGIYKSVLARPTHWGPSGQEVMPHLLFSWARYSQGPSSAYQAEQVRVGRRCCHQQNKIIKRGFRDQTDCGWGQLAFNSSQAGLQKDQSMGKQELDGTMH